MSENLELREWIAVNLMGYAVERFNGTLVRAEPVDEIDFTVPHYELTWNDAALVVEAMREKGHRVEIGCGKSFMCTIFVNYTPVRATGDTGPLAICLAAKAAIEATQ